MAGLDRPFFLRRFLSERAGNLAITFAIALAPLTAAVGGAMDYTRAVMVGSELQAALDSGVLASASLTQNREPEDVVRAYVEAALGDKPELLSSLTVNVTSDLALNSRVVRAEAAVEVPAHLLGLLGLSKIPVRRVSDAEEQARHIEISLVLDISSSMAGSRIDSLREAALDFVDTVLEADEEELTSISVVPYGGTVQLDDTFFRFVSNEEEFSLGGFDWSIPLPETAADWNGCLEMTDRQVTDITLDLNDHGVLPSFTIWNSSNNWCPDKPGTEAVFLTNDRTRLRNLIARFDNPILSDGTGTDIAASWGVRALDPAWRGGLNGDADFSDRPAEFDDEETMKVMVVMTDGGITEQYRPEEDWDPEEDETHVTTRGADRLYNKNAARGNFDAMCDHAKDNGVLVYSIAFQVRGGRVRDDMRDCATSPGQFYDVRDLDIAEAFSAIAAELNMLRLSR